MKRHQLLLGILITSCVMLFSASTTDLSAPQHQNFRINQTGLVYSSTCWPSLPAKDSRSEKTSYFRELASVSNQSSACFIRINLLAGSPFNNYPDIQSTEKSSSTEAPIFVNLFGALFRAIISPNAP